MKQLLDQLCLVHSFFRRDYPTPDEKRSILQEYARVLTQRQISETAFRYGLGQISHQDYYPNPARFAVLCQATPESLGLPSVEDAFREACERSADPKAEAFSHLAIYHAGRSTGWFELRHGGTPKQLDSLKKTFREHYQRYRQQEEPQLRALLPQPKPFRPLPPPPPPDHEQKKTAAESREALRRLFGDKNTES